MRVLEYDNLFIFDEIGWNFEPVGVIGCIRAGATAKLPEKPRGPEAELRPSLSEHFGAATDVFMLPRTTAELDTAWHMFPVLIRAESGVRRSEFQRHMESQRGRHPDGVDW